ncbi:lamin tail domain-containing protein [Empedobacter brevis]
MLKKHDNICETIKTKPLKGIFFFILLFFFFIQHVAAQNWSDVPFVVMEKKCPSASTSTEIYISELFDQKPGSYGVIELYNPTNSPINLLTQKYKLKRYLSYTATTSFWTYELKGIINPKSTYQIVINNVGSYPNYCDVIANESLNGNSHGINKGDRIELTKGSSEVKIDEARIIKDNISVIRNPSAIAPKSVYIASDWYIGEPNCVTVGTPPLLDVLKIERDVTLPNYSLCKLPARIKLTLGGGSGTYNISDNNGTTYKEFKAPWFINPNVSTSGEKTYVIQDKKNTGCYIKFEFDVVQNPLPKIAPIEMN